MPELQPDEPILIPRALASGAWRGAMVEGEARVRLHQRGIVLAWSDGRAEWRVPFADLSGFALRADALWLFGVAGNVSLTSTYHLAGLCRAMQERACALPELARGARSVGSRRGGDPNTQARFFAPVLDARRRAEMEGTAEGKIRALDGPTIATQVNQFLAEVARGRWPENLPEQRALGAELEECCEVLFAMCEGLHIAASAWFESPEEHRLTAWRDWVLAAARVFTASDRAWGQVALVLQPAADR
ncbi:MAG TPA: hypothetical protein VJ717_14145 [Gemmatimonadaceae bacterium]|nr:hypothetical protein [Gemmatimonadaceae bacterium]